MTDSIEQMQRDGLPVVELYPDPIGRPRWAWPFLLFLAGLAAAGVAGLVDWLVRG